MHGEKDFKNDTRRISPRLRGIFHVATTVISLQDCVRVWLVNFGKNRDCRISSKLKLFFPIESIDKGEGEEETIMSNIIPYLVKIIDLLNCRDSRIPFVGGGGRKENCRLVRRGMMPLSDDQIFAFGKIEQLYKESSIESDHRPYTKFRLIVQVAATKASKLGGKQQ